jgi:hypothetical protein
MPQMMGPTEVVGGGGGTDPGLFSATCAAGVLVGQFVRLTGAPGPAVEAADAYLQAKIPGIGVVVDKPTLVTCSIRTLGSAAVFSGLTPGKVYWLNTAGGISPAPPVAALGTVRYAQAVGYALDATTLMVDIDPTVRGFDR